MEANSLASTSERQTEQSLQGANLPDYPQLTLTGSLRCCLPWFLTQRAIQKILARSRETAHVKEHWGSIVAVFLLTVSRRCIGQRGW
jgi:hypothetical protein